jgi:hypothetical protein
MMWTTGIRRVFSGVGAVALLAIPGTLFGQQLVTAAMEGVDLEKAEVLEAQAIELMEDAGSWPEAASLLRQAAALRPVSDARGAENLISAGRLAYFDGDAVAALVDLESAAMRASISDDAPLAARAYLDAAWVADKANLEGHRSRLVAQLDRLAGDDGLDWRQKREIERRVKTDNRPVLTARDVGLGMYRVSN